MNGVICLTGCAKSNDNNGIDFAKFTNLLTKLTADVEALRKSSAVKSPEEQQKKADSGDATATLNEMIIPVQAPAIGTNDENIDNGGNSAELENKYHEAETTENFSTEVEEMIMSKIKVETTKGLDGKPKDNNNDDESSVPSV